MSKLLSLYSDTGPETSIATVDIRHEQSEWWRCCFHRMSVCLSVCLRVVDRSIRPVLVFNANNSKTVKASGVDIQGE